MIQLEFTESGGINYFNTETGEGFCIVPKTKNTDGTYAPPTAYDISGASHWSNQSDVILTVHRTFENDTTEVITRKVREQGLYGKIGTASFKYKTEKRCFVAAHDVDWDIPQHWSDN